ncbi:MAG TPA: glycine cleavage system protein GcvH [Verrucomicrobiales bacterium]|jgi:glycine cleavage system H protein|nr:glycine cleavage system protein GcvH [Verrucomicrobiales bacterium]
MSAPANARFTASHEWILAGEEISPIGISDHAQAELGDVVYIELPSPGRIVTAGEPVAVIESVKAASDIYAPVAGEIVAVNEDVSSNTALVNTAPYSDGWLFKIKPSNPADVNALMDEAAYLASVG